MGGSNHSRRVILSTTLVRSAFNPESSINLIQMDIISFLISAGLFALFVPSVVMRLPPRGSHNLVLLTHALLFALVTHLIMKYYWTGRFELFGNYGPTCPNGYVPGVNQGGKPDCVPSGHATYAGTAK